MRQEPHTRSERYECASASRSVGEGSVAAWRGGKRFVPVRDAESRGRAGQWINQYLSSAGEKYGVCVCEDRECEGTGTETEGRSLRALVFFTPKCSRTDVTAQILTLQSSSFVPSFIFRPASHRSPPRSTSIFHNFPYIILAKNSIHHGLRSITRHSLRSPNSSKK